MYLYGWMDKVSVFARKNYKNVRLSATDVIFIDSYSSKLHILSVRYVFGSKCYHVHAADQKNHAQNHCQ